MMNPEKKIKVVLIEDSRTEAAVTKALLEDSEDGRMQIFTARDLAGGMVSLTVHRPDAVILDLMLPDSDGHNSISAIHKYYPDLPIVVLSGHADQIEILRCLENGAQEFLLKGEVSDQMIRQAIFNAMFRHSLKKAK